MHSQRKTAIGLLLLLGMTAGTMVSCGAQTETEPSGDAAQTAATLETETVSSEPEITTAIPADVNFGGKECRIFNFDSASWNTQLLAAAEDGEVLNDAIYKRNVKVEDMLGVKLVETRESEWNTAYDTARKILAAADDAYEIMFLNDRNSLSVAQEGYIEPLNNIPYVDLTREYWSQTINEDISIQGKLYFSYGDFNLTGYEAVNVLLVNKKIVADYDLADPYDVVLDGYWTLDLLAENMKAVTHDVNGDGVFDDQDAYGITSHHKQVLPCFWVASGLRTITKNEKDEPEFALIGNEPFATFYDRIMDIMYTDNVYFNSKTLPSYANNTLFINGQALYNIVRVAFMKYYRDMDYDYAIVPFPKFDAAQETYYSRFEGGALSFTPKVCANKEIAGAVYETLACESMKTVIPAYYDVVLKSKYARDVKSTVMLDIIYQNRVCDLGDTFFCDQIRDGTFADKFDRNDRKLQSTIKSMTKKVEKALEKTIAAFDAID